MNWTKGKRVKRCPRCKIYTEKNEGCNHMTCVSCKYQWCWLCEGEYKYGHYDYGKCQGQQFAKADYPVEIKNNNNNYNYNNNNYYRNGRNCNFGLHKIFRCVYPEGVIPLYCSGEIGDNLAIKYPCIFIFWLLGIFVIFNFICDQYQFSTFINLRISTEDFVRVMAILTGLTLCIPFQIAFICLTSPFILICIIYHKFFNIFLIFFGLEY